MLEKKITSSLELQYAHKNLSQKISSLKPKTLKESVQRKRLVSELKVVEERMLGEHYANLLMEAIDKDEFQQASKVLNKLNAIKKVADSDVNLKGTLGAAIKEASNEVNEFTGGGAKALFKKGAGALQAKFGLKPSKNPLLKSLEFLNILETGLSVLPEIFANNISG